MLPSQVFKERIITCFIDDAFGVDNRRYLNIDNITWECDYPHSDSTWPHSPESAMKYLAEIPDEDINKITHLNAMKHFKYDPFSIRPREQCTVEALRAEATDVDLSMLVRSEAAKERTKNSPLDLISMASRSSADGAD
jgi:hypothetical protein